MSDFKEQYTYLRKFLIVLSEDAERPDLARLFSVTAHIHSMMMMMMSGYL